MQSKWGVPGLFSGKNPATVAAGEPPDPPDPSSSLSPNNFPSLLEAKTIPKSSNYRFGTFPRFGTVPSASSKGIKHPTAVAPKALPAMTNGTTACETDSALPPSTVSDFRSVTDTIPVLEKERNLQQGCRIVSPSTSSPTLTNKASSSHQSIPIPSQQTTDGTIQHPILPTPVLTGDANASSSSQTIPSSLVQKIKLSEDKTLHRQAPVTIAASGRPRVLIPDSVFQKGAELHKDFIICYFNGKAPPFNQIQSVFNHMWGKGKRLEIHNNPLNRSVLVRIHSEYLRQKILEKNICLTLAHVKVEVDLTQPLPSVVEFERENGEVVEVSVHYPWVPPTCSHCHELGHVMRNCLHYTSPPADEVAAKKKQPVNHDLGLAAVPAASDAPLSDPITAVVPSLAPTPLLSPHQSSFAITPGLTLNRSASINHSLNPFLTPEPQQRPSLKRSPDPYGRIILIWRDSINVQILSESRQCITCKINFPNHQPILYSAIYASNLSSERVELWTELIHLQTSLGLDNTNWILGGDLNQIIHPMEHSEPSITSPDFLMYQLRDCFTQLGLFDLRYIGPTLTWINSRPENPISKKLDRLMVNNSLVSSFPDALASFLPPIFSDHSPCVLDLAFNLPLAETQPYKFQNYLIKHPGFAQLLQDAWIQAGNVSQTLTQLCWKLKQIKSDLKLLNKENYSKIQERVSETNGNDDPGG
ncbi:hypothetical protein DY000_02031882 [Brassica cretica]|uniref:DUF4283 domain-containing protein n=1 Tax=Brassica cretica TaxID=69181 RepID=A0ABQ7DP97_BRACR|nr:hypothetical protein DY000_02031882 [Brassica cretica]